MWKKDVQAVLSPLSVRLQSPLIGGGETEDRSARPDKGMRVSSSGVKFLRKWFVSLPG